MIKIEKLNPFGRMCISLGMLPSSYKESLTYEEQLLWFFKYLDETVIPTVNNNADAVEELQTLYTEIKSYVDSYFDNLDVQEEINNKLDEMAESGQLTDIIAQYLQLAGVLAFNTLNDLKNAENIVEGSICKTLGYETYNDGYGAFYKIRTITSSDVVDNINIVALQISNTLIAEKIFNNDLESLKNDMSLIKNKKYLLVGDSYAVGYQGSGQATIEGFFTKVKNDLNLNATIIAANGYGFLGIDNNLKWINLIDNANITDKNSYTDIIICGGMNDRGQDETIGTSMIELFNYLKQNFINAEIHVGCVGKYASASSQNLINMRRISNIYKFYTIKNGFKYIDGSELILHNMAWFIEDNIHPNVSGELQLAYGIEQYIINGEINNFMSIENLRDWQTDTITSSDDNITLNLDLYSLMTKEITTLYFSGQINYTNNITITNLTDIVIGKLTNSYVCGSSNYQGIDEVITGYVYSPTSINDSHFVKVIFRLYNDNENNLHLKAFTVSDDGNYKSLTINQIAFPYGAIKCMANSKYC